MLSYIATHCPCPFRRLMPVRVSSLVFLTLLSLHYATCSLITDRSDPVGDCNFALFTLRFFAAPGRFIYTPVFSSRWPFVINDNGERDRGASVFCFCFFFVYPRYWKRKAASPRLFHIYIFFVICDYCYAIPFLFPCRGAVSLPSLFFPRIIFFHYHRIFRNRIIILVLLECLGYYVVSVYFRFKF